MEEHKMSNIYGVCYTTKEPVVYNKGTQWEKTCSDFLFIQANKDNGTELVELILKYYDQLSEKYRKMIPLKMVYIPVPVEE